MQKSLIILILCISSFFIKAQTQVDFYTNYGNFRVMILEDLVPITGGNFLNLVDSGFYDGLIFHRVIDEFMIQGGDPTGTGSGGSDSSIVLEIHDSLRFDSAGVIGMARTSDPNSATSQFFVTLEETDWLNENYAIFGYVTNGMNVVDTIGMTETNSSDRPLDSIVMCKVIRATGDFSTIKSSHCAPYFEASIEGSAALNKNNVRLFPNPFKDQMNISFEIHTTTDVRLEIYDLLGRMIVSIEEDVVSNGQYTIRNSQLSELNTGTYYYRIHFNDKTQSGTLIKAD